jgi:cytosine/adenosine deaminase-related metal-dependent hydrolase
MTTLIRNAAWVVAFDPATGTHAYRRDCDVAFTGDRIVHVGSGFAGEAEEVVDGRGLMVMPGLVNIHSHPASEPMMKGWNDELGSAKLWGSSLYEFMPLLLPDAEGTRACATVAYGEALMSGVTTLVDLSVAWEGWIEALAGSGLRGVVAPMYRSARWHTRNGHVVVYDWDEAAGRHAMEGALALLDEAARHRSGRLSGMVAPAQIDTCTPELIRDSFAEAQARDLPFQIHAAQSVVEFHEITRRHGMTPIEWLDSLGVLSPRSIVGHGIFLDHHSSALNWPKRDDLGSLAGSGTTVAHCPVVFQRRGIAMQSLGLYLRRGVPIGIGTDTFPHNMLEEIRAACIGSRMMSEDVFDLRLSQVIHAATIGGARALGRDDIGRIAPGAKADLVLVDVTHPAMRPVRDPLRSLVYQAAERAVRTVFVDGRRVVDGGRVLTLDLDAAAEALHEAQRRAEPRVAALDWAGRDHLAVSPLTFPDA